MIEEQLAKALTLGLICMVLPIVVPWLLGLPRDGFDRRFFLFGLALVCSVAFIFLIDLLVGFR